MDDYLASLKLKDEEVTDKTEVSAETDVIVEDTTPADDLTADAEATFNDQTTPETEPEETEEIKMVEVKEEPNKEANSKSEGGLSIGNIISVSNIRVYRSPDTKQIARNVTGNITYLGTIGDFKIVEYMKHGFGLVRGYTIDPLI